MRRTIPRLICAVGLALLAGCASAPSRFYTLRPTAPPGDGGASGVAVIVGPVSIPGAVDRPEFVVQLSQNRVAVDEFNRWAGGLADGIARTVAVDLAALLGSPRVATAPLANFEPDYRVTIDVQRFETTPGDSTLLDAVWVVRGSGGAKPRAGRTVARESVEGGDYDALAAAHSRALGKLSADIAAAIRSESGGRP